MTSTRKARSLAPEKVYDLLMGARTADRATLYFKDGRQITGAMIFNPFKGTGRLINIDSESSMTSHPNWMNGVRIGTTSEDHVNAFIPPFDADSRPYQGAAGEGVAVDADGNVYAAEGPNSLRWAGGALTKYVAGG